MKKDEFETIANSQKRPDKQSSQQFSGTQENLVTDQSHQTANPPDRLLSGDSDRLDTVPLQQRNWLLPGVLGAGIVAIAAIAVGTRFLPQGETPSSNPASVTTPSPANSSESNVPPAASSQEKMLLAQAKLLADGGEAKQLAQAIEIAQQIPNTASEYPQAQTSIATWSEQILQQAKTQASRGDLSKAIAIAQSIPVNTKAHTKAQQQITTWNQSLSNQRKTIQPPVATKAVPRIDPQQKRELTRIRATETQQQRELARLREIEAQKQRELTRIRATEAQQQRELARLRDTEAQQQQQLAGIQTSKTPTQKSFDSLRGIESQQQGELARLAEAEAQQQQELARLRAAEAEQQQELARLQASEAQKQQELQRLRNEARQQQELTRLQTNQTQTQPPSSNPSNLSSDDPYLNIDIPKVQPQPRTVSPPAQISSAPVLSNSYGFRNITVKGAKVAIELRDNVDEDGDYVTLRVNGRVYANNQLILNRGTVIMVDLQPGANQVDIVGVKDGRGGITVEANIAGVGNVNRRPIPEGRTASFIINRE